MESARVLEQEPQENEANEEAQVLASVEEDAGAEMAGIETSTEAIEAVEVEEVSADEAVERVYLEAREALSALLFVAPRPLSVAQMLEWCAQHCQKLLTLETLEEELLSLKAVLAESGFGFELLEIGGQWQLRSTTRCAQLLREMIPPRARKLSRAAAETLAVIAYKQPVPRSEIEGIRGVDALPTIKTLLDARLIRVIGRDETPGHPALYGTTQIFLEKYGLKDLAELPTVREISELASEPGEVADSEQMSTELEFPAEEVEAESVATTA